MTQSVKFKRGDKNRSSGMVFYRYSGTIEVWVTPGDFEKKLAQDKARNQKHLAHRDKHGERERLKTFRLNNPEKCSEYSKRWRKMNPELCVQRSLKSRAKKIDEYREKEKERMREYRAENPEESRMQSSIQESARRAAIRGAKSPSHSKGIEMQLRLIASRLTQCLGASFHVDHITPISRGGIHHHLNMRVIPAKLNQIKYKRTDSECPPTIKTALENWTL